MQIVLRHRTASGGAMTNIWEFEESAPDIDQPCIVAAIQVAGAEVVHVAIRISSVRKRSRERLEYAISAASGSGESWRLEHGRYDGHLADPRLPDLTLTLTNAPPDVARELARIASR